MTDKESIACLLEEIGIYFSVNNDLMYQIYGEKDKVTKIFYSGLLTGFNLFKSKIKDVSNLSEYELNYLLTIRNQLAVSGNVLEDELVKKHSKK